MHLNLFNLSQRVVSLVKPSPTYSIDFGPHAGPKVLTLRGKISRETAAR